MIKAGAHDYVMKDNLARLVPAIEREIRAGLERQEGHRTATALEYATSLLQTVLRNAPITIFATDADGVFTVSDGKGLERVGLEPGANVGCSAVTMFGAVPFVTASRTEIAGDEVIRRALAGESIAAISQHGEIWFDNRIGPIRNADGKIVGLVGVATDITERMAAEDAIRRALKEKEILLREIHHRVKNNTQLISSLRYFHARRHAGPCAAVFTELRQRIFAMTLVHERLYLARDLSRVDFGDHVRALVAELARSFEPRAGIRVEVTAAADVHLPSELALPSGMIVCELVTNVLKYAFPGARDGTATVRVQHAGSDIVLDVDDDGVGFPDGFDPHGGGGFGWELICMLVLQLDGTVEVTTREGSHVRVVFPLAADAEVTT